MNKRQNMDQVRRALQMFAQSLDEHDAMEIACVYEAWVPGKEYKGGEYFTHGVNSVGDPQLYRVNEGKPHTAQKTWTPDVERTLYTPIGLDSAGYPIWSQPTGVHDAYDLGDVVDRYGLYYESLIPANTTVPGTDERYWKRRDDL